MSDHDEQARELTRRARLASRALARATTAKKDAVLWRITAALKDPAVQGRILEANRKDLAAGQEAGLSRALLDRLTLDEERLLAIAQAVHEIEKLPDPIGHIEDLKHRPSGIQVGRMRVPLGVVLMVYESRPNVTIDTAVLCLKAGNAVILRGGKEARRSNAAFADVIADALEAEGLPPDAAKLVTDTDRELLYALLRRSGEIDLAIPRGGTSLIDSVNEHARIPVIQHYQGVCHVYVHRSADLDLAERICVNGKVQRPGVCNATEGVIVDEAIADEFVPRLVRTLKEHHVEVRADHRAAQFAGPMEVLPATDKDWDTEFLDLVCTLKVVDGFDEALAFLGNHSSGHTEAIVARDHDRAMRFLREVDASCVLVNASTRFNDGGELGLGAELGISTTKLHAYGPMGLEELTARKFIVLGHGETRGTPP